MIPRALPLRQGWFSLQTLQQSYGRNLLLLEQSKIYRANLGKPHADGNPAREGSPTPGQLASLVWVRATRATEDQSW